MFDDFKSMLSKFQKKQDNEEELDIKGLIRFEPGFLENIPSMELKYVVYNSSFGIRKIYPKIENKKNNEIIKDDSVTIYSDNEKLLYLIDKFSALSKESEHSKYKRILNQSKLLGLYKKRDVEPEFIDSMIKSMPLEYEMEIICESRNGLKLNKNKFRIYIDDLNQIKEFEKEINEFREESLNKILENKVNGFKRKI
ncbi:hypothetical protein JXB41_08445 [Candidatus Woesearchaeota archaeon]|nr:hypothetical protein [Candidatus Woesearchaeota archaeon]